MLIAGAGGLGKEILGILIQDAYCDEIVFYDENRDMPGIMYDKYTVYKQFEEARNYLANTDSRFICGIGNPRLREKMAIKLEDAGGTFCSVISGRTSIFHFNIPYEGVIIQPGVGISHNVNIGKGSAIHINSTIGHSTEIGRFVNIGPNVSVIGPVKIGDYSYIGAQATVLPNLTIGKNVIVGAGKIVNKNLDDFETC